MELYIFSGFLGSGKTTLATALVRQLAEKYNCRFMLIVNDIGKIGIDGQFMRRLGGNVYELFGGCICCQLGNDLVALLREITAKYHVDFILMEASGVAEPARIVETVQRYGPPGLKVKVIVLVDVTRWLEIRQVLGPLVTGQLLAADWILVNKIDIAGEERIAHVLQDIQSLKPQGEVIMIAACREADVAKITEVILHG